MVDRRRNSLRQLTKNVIVFVIFDPPLRGYLIRGVHHGLRPFGKPWTFPESILVFVTLTPLGIKETVRNWSWWVWTYRRKFLDALFRDTLRFPLGEATFLPVLSIFDIVLAYSWSQKRGSHRFWCESWNLCFGNARLVSRIDHRILNWIRLWTWVVVLDRLFLHTSNISNSLIGLSDGFNRRLDFVKVSNPRVVFVWRWNARWRLL